MFVVVSEKEARGLTAVVKKQPIKEEMRAVKYSVSLNSVPQPNMPNESDSQPLLEETDVKTKFPGQPDRCFHLLQQARLGNENQLPQKSDF